MVGGTRIIAFGSGSHEGDAGDEFLLTQEVTETPAEPVEWLEEEPEATRSRWQGWLAPVLVVGAILAWTAFFVFARLPELANASARDWSAQTADWSLPVLLIGMAWLLALRTSRREAVRFGDAARLLSSESANLETRLTAVNRELSLAREFIAAQSRDLESLGRIATERLSHNADRLQALIHDNGAQVDAIGSVSSAALENMEKLRGQLPVIASSAKDVTNNIANAGLTAHAQIEDMINGFKRINEFGQASERQVLTLRERVDSALSEFAVSCEKLDDLASNRFAALAERSFEFRTRLDSDEVEALAAIRTRAAAMTGELEQTRQLLDSHEAEALTSLRARMVSLRDEAGAIGRSLRDTQGNAVEGWQAAVSRMDLAMGEAMERLAAFEAEASALAERRALTLDEQASRFESDLIARRDAATEADAAATAAMAERLTALDADLAMRREAQAGHVATLSNHADGIVAQLQQVEARMAEIAAHGGEAERRVAGTLAGLAEHLGASRATLSGADHEIAALTDASVRLLELIQATVQHSREQIPVALAASEQSLATAEERVRALGTAADQAARRGEDLAMQVDQSRTRLEALAGELDAAHQRLQSLGDGHASTLSGLRDTLAGIEAHNARIAEAARTELATAIETLTGSARTGVETLRDSGARSIEDLAARLETEAAAAVERAISAGTAETTRALEAAVARATGASREAALQFRDQLAKVDELAGNLERRVTQARSRAEEQVDNDFSRRAALITESLNSHAIDIARALSADVADTAWAAYLRGDRGIFTRRAVSLIEAGDAKAIAQIYDSEREFREHVSRYIHDFEAILRQVLSTRDGHALGVTLLSSDMGKLYVVLAQAIERLRA